jgi:hypothetical protein
MRKDGENIKKRINNNEQAIRELIRRTKHNLMFLPQNSQTIHHPQNNQMDINQTIRSLSPQFERTRNGLSPLRTNGTEGLNNATYRYSNYEHPYEAMSYRQNDNSDYISHMQQSSPNKR